MNIKTLSTLTSALMLTSGVALASGMSPMEFGIDRPGSDYRSFVTVQDNPQLCQDQCAAESKCQAWTYASDAMTCWLKNPAPAAVILNKRGISSGVKVLP